MMVTGLPVKLYLRRDKTRVCCLILCKKSPNILALLVRNGEVFETNTINLVTNTIVHIDEKNMYASMCTFQAYLPLI